MFVFLLRCYRTHTNTHTNAHCKYLNPTLAQSPNTYLGVLMVEVPEPSPSPPPQRANISDNPCWASAQSWCAEKSVGAADLKETLSRSERRSATEWGGGGRVRAWDEGRGGWRRRRRRRERREGVVGGEGRWWRWIVFLRWRSCDKCWVSD